MRSSSLIILFLSATIIYPQAVCTHCEIPCGIYNDAMRLDMIAEDIETVEKSMKEITALSKGKEKNYNQLVRWIVNKDEHATRIQETVWQYFMTQRVKPVGGSNEKEYRSYIKQLTQLHQMLVYAMKAKQTTGIENVKMLRKLLASFRAAYLGEYKDGYKASGGKEKHPHSHNDE